MKIDKTLLPSLNNPEKKSVNNREKLSGTSFESILKKAKNSYREGKSVSAASELGNINPASVVVPVQVKDGIFQAVTMAEDTLASLDSLGKLLSQPKVSKDSLKNVVGDMSAKARKLEEVSSLIPESSSLKTLLEQIYTMAAKEAAKFERGDYTG